MSIQAVAWVLDHSASRGRARLVLISIANHADKESGECWPGQRTIAREGGVGISSVPPAVRKLVELGELEVINAGDARRTAHYRMTFKERSTVEQSAPSPSTDPVDKGAPYTSTPAQGWSAARAPERAQRARQDRAEPSLTIRHSLEEEDELEKRRASKLLLDALVDAVRYAPKTKLEIAEWSTVVEDLADLDATAADIADRARRYRDRWPDAQLTPRALMRHWSSLAASTATSPPVDAAAKAACADCDGNGWRISTVNGEPSTRCPTCNPNQGDTSP